MIESHNEDVSHLNSIFSQNHESNHKETKTKTKWNKGIKSKAHLQNNSSDTLMQYDANNYIQQNHQLYSDNLLHQKVQRPKNQMLDNDMYPPSEMKKLRLKISDFNKSTVIDTVCQKVSKKF